MRKAIFLSASVPDPRSSPTLAATADSVAITAAVSALVYVTLGRRSLIWGGHPAITPMIVCAAENRGIDYESWVKLYQSNYFKGKYPEDNKNFQNVVYTSAGRDREDSLLLMRRRMFSEKKFHAAVFVGGMEGVIEESKLFQKLQPQAKIIPIASTGGAAEVIFRSARGLDEDLSYDLDYVALLHRHLDIDALEKRYPTPAHQPNQRRSHKPSSSDPSP